MDERDGALVSIKEITKLRQSKSLKEMNAFTWFWDSLLECVAGTSSWGEQKHAKMMSDIVTVSDEAFALFLFEASRNKWIAEWENEKRGANTEVPSALYGLGGRCNDKTFHPWDDAGIQRYKDLRDYVQKDRENDEGEKAEKRMLVHIQENHGFEA